MSVGHEENTVESNHGDQHEKHNSDHSENGDHHEQDHVLAHEDIILDDKIPRPSAPPADDNGYILVPPTPQTSVVDSVVDHVVDQLSQATKEQEDINKLLADLSNSTDSSLKELPKANKIVAEADSSTHTIIKEVEHKTTPVETSKNTKKCEKSCATGLCPYYLLAMNSLCKVQVPPKVNDLLLWKNPKLTGAVFGSTFVLLLSLASFSFLTVVSTLLLLASSVIGAYRLYLTLLFRIKGTQDDTFEKLSAFNLSLPKNKIQDIANLLETDLNSLLTNLRSILLWENIPSSIKAFFVFYLIYWVGSIFNTLTLVILAFVGIFTLPKVYQIYKTPIDQALEKATTFAHTTVKQVMAKLPFLNTKKTQ